LSLFQKSVSYFIKQDKSLIRKTFKKINMMVYALYRLCADEIAIVEGTK